MAKPSKFELKLLRHLWRSPRLSAREIHQASQQETNWSYSATRKTLDRMAEKGLVRIEVVHGIKTFAAVAAKLETLAGLISDFAKNMLGADAPLSAAAFAQSKVIDAGEIEALEALLEKLDDEESN